ncbi:MAG: hypothetical protein JEY94_07595 [Melioribacteraceae bacterium]|nr:hypothetical protein [Melioribacteraceae bacterium]
MKDRIIDLNVNNPLADLIADETYELLRSKGLINEKNVRDRIIKNKFQHLRDNKFSAGDAIEKIREDYPYLQYDSIRKIVYQKFVN